MRKFVHEQGLVVPLDRSNVDTDAIIPKQFLKSIHRHGFGVNLFDTWRYEDIGIPGQDCSKRTLRKDFVLNLPRYQGGSILLARDNFGCGSSREHAPWALADYGFNVIIAPSFADIFFNNCFKNSILPIVLSSEVIDSLFVQVQAIAGYRLDIDLEEQSVKTANGLLYRFEVDEFRKYCLLNGLDDIGLTLQHADDIKRFEEKYKQLRPWLFRTTPER